MCLCRKVASPSFFFFFNDTATTEIYTLSLHDALPIYGAHHKDAFFLARFLDFDDLKTPGEGRVFFKRSEEHTSELQSQSNLVCRLLLEKKKKQLTSLTLTFRHTPAYAPHTLTILLIRH